MLVVCGQDRKDIREHKVKREVVSQQAGLGRNSEVLQWPNLRARKRL